MNIEGAFNNAPRFDNGEYKRLMEGFIERKPITPIIEQVREIFVVKKAIDIYKAEKRAMGCGCRNCHIDAQNTRTWYG